MLNRNEYSKRKIPTDKDEKKPLKFCVLELFEQVNLQPWSTRLWNCKSCSKPFKNDPVHLWLALLALEIGRHLYFEKRRKTHEVTGLLAMFPVQGIGTNFKRPLNKLEISRKCDTIQPELTAIDFGGWTWYISVIFWTMFKGRNVINTAQSTFC